MVIVNDLNELTLEYVNYNDVYVKDNNIHIKIYQDVMYIRKLQNAMMRGKQVQLIKIFLCNSRDIITTISEYINEKLTFGQFINDVLEYNLDYEIFELVFCEENSKKIFSPFIKLKKINLKKWTISNVIKTILSEQIKRAEIRKCLTDDYYGDSKSNFGKGQYVNLMELCKELIEDPTGWKVNGEPIEMGKYLKIEIASRSYNNYITLYFKQ